MIKDIMNEYNVSFDDFIYEQLVEIMKILRNNISKELKDSEKNERNYTRLLKNPPAPKEQRYL